MAYSGIYGTGITILTNPNPNTLTTRNPYPTPYLDYRTVSTAWTSQGIKAFFAKSTNGLPAKNTSLNVHLVPSVSGATFSVTLWVFNKLTGTWAQVKSSPTTNYTGETVDTISNLIDVPYYLQLNSISSGTMSIYFDNGFADAC